MGSVAAAALVLPRSRWSCRRPGGTACWRQMTRYGCGVGVRALNARQRWRAGSQRTPRCPPTRQAGLLLGKAGDRPLKPAIPDLSIPTTALNKDARPACTLSASCSRPRAALSKAELNLRQQPSTKTNNDVHCKIYIAWRHVRKLQIGFWLQTLPGCTRHRRGTDNINP